MLVVRIVTKIMSKTKVVFIKDATPHDGRAGDIKDVAGGFFRNLLFPRGIAVLAAPSSIKQAEIMKQKREHAEKIHRERIETYAKELEGVTLEFVKKANEQDGLFDAVDKREILAALHRKGFTEIEEKHIDLERPFDKIGEYTLNLNFGENLLTPTIKIIVIKEE